MAFPIEPPIEPMLAELQDEIPTGPEWLYEPKWDGFRAIVFRDGDAFHLGSRKGQPLQRYFPELLELFKTALPDRCVLDGEIIIPGPKGLDFDALLQRIHPAASRINRLAQETPASFVAFDLLAVGDEDLRQKPLSERRRRLEQVVKSSLRVAITPQTRDRDEASRWFVDFEGAGLDGVIAKPETIPYVPGERVMVKIKHERTCDCVVGGYRMHKDGQGVGSLLLGLYDDQGVLHHVGHTAAFTAKMRRELLEQVKPLEGKPSFGEGRTPGGPSRWAQGRDVSWTSLDPKLVCEVKFDYLQGPRFRHAAKLLRWRPDKAPEQCTWKQLEPPKPFDLEKALTAKSS
jgi:ATP-dependent DNA ligase